MMHYTTTGCMGKVIGTEARCLPSTGCNSLPDWQGRQERSQVHHVSTTQQKECSMLEWFVTPPLAEWERPEQGSPPPLQVVWTVGVVSRANQHQQVLSLIYFWAAGRSLIGSTTQHANPKNPGEYGDVHVHCGKHFLELWNNPVVAGSISWRNSEWFLISLLQFQRLPPRS